MQKSQVELLRTLLFETLRHDPALIQIVCSTRWHAQIVNKTKDEPWSREELFVGFRNALSQDHEKSKFCFFVDGLDEYSRDSFDKVKFIASLSTSPDTKLCFQQEMDCFHRRVYREGS